MNDTDKILVGKIVAPQGIRGEVRVQTYTNTPTDFKSLRVISSKFAPDDFKFVRQLNPNSTVIIAKIRGFEDRTAVEALRGTELFIERNALPQTDDDEYYQADLIGFDVVRDGKKIGVVDCFQNFGAGDIIELDNGDMVSFIGATVDMNAKTVVVK
ncbi:MAG: 16S rRNA processing protein RimM [Alphaproteobacteria bacterium]|jgi:16S rRNA processing protein RimM|nr:16S rRNA processing protein RimM [Alphaproteobacteria bacterium]